MNILITGANGGIGSEIVKVLADSSLLEPPHHFYLHHFRKEGKKTLQKITQGLPGTFEYLPCDFMVQEQLDIFLDTLRDKKIDCLIHSVSLPTTLSDLLNKDWEDFEKHWQTQVKSFFLLIKTVAISMQQRRFGRIVSIATEYTVGRPPAKLADYVVAKSALVALTKSAAIELGKFGITCNSISPGLTQTPLTDHLPNKLKEIIAAQTPTGRLTTPQDISSLLAFLCSKAAGQINGENIVINGGYTLR